MFAALKNAFPLRKAPAGQAESAPFRLEVASHGRTLFVDRFEPGDYVLGASPGADVIISDLDDDEAALLRLEIVGLAGIIMLTPLVPGLEARGRIQELHRPLMFPDRCSFQIGAFEINASYDPARRPLAAPNSLPLVLIAGSVLVGAGALIAGRSDAVTPNIDRVQVTAVNVERAVPDQMAAAASNLRLRLLSANLVPTLTVTQENGLLVVSGTVNADERARAMETLGAIRSRLGVPLEMRLRSDPDPGGFVTAVALKPEAYVVGRDGRRYAPGQRLPDGGVIEAIDGTSIVLDRDGIKERVVFAR